MTRWLFSVRYAPQGASGVARAGFASRRAVVSRATEALGGKLTDFWASGANEWDAVFIVEGDVPSSRLSANSVLMRASGAIEAVHAQELFDVEDVDKLLQGGTPDWRPPGH